MVFAGSAPRICVAGSQFFGGHYTLISSLTAFRPPNPPGFCEDRQMDGSEPGPIEADLDEWLSYNDAKEHFHWDKNMESLLEIVADNLVED